MRVIKAPLGRSVIYLMLLLVACHGGAEEESFGILIHHSGEAFSIIRAEGELYFDLATDELSEVRFLPGDYLLTEDKTVLWIRLGSTSNILKVQENTGLLISTLSASGSGDFTLSYGSVRAKVDLLSEEDSLNINTRGVSAEARQTDFGYDLVAEKGAKTVQTKLYCYEGSVEILGDNEEKLVTLDANQMVTLDAKNPEPVITPTELPGQDQAADPVLAGGEFVPGEQEIGPAAAQGEPKRSIVELAAGMDIIFWLLPPEIREQTAGGTSFSALLNIMTILMTLRAGPILDLTFRLAKSFGLGLEVGGLYMTYEIESVRYHAINAPVLAIFPITPGPLILQPYAGVEFLFTVIEESEFSYNGFVYQGGGKLGFNTGSLSLYGNFGVVVADPGEFFSNVDSGNELSYLYKFGIGGLLKF